MNFFQNNHFWICKFQAADKEEDAEKKKRSKKCERKYKLRQKNAKVEQALEEQFMTGRVLGN